MQDLFGDTIIDNDIESDENENTKITIFDIIKNLVTSKKDIYNSLIKENENLYVFSVINKYVSLFSATNALYANELNSRYSMPTYMQYQYYLNALPKLNNTFIKYIKHDTSNNDKINAIKKYYNCNTKIAKMYIKNLSSDEINYIISITSNYGND